MKKIVIAVVALSCGMMWGCKKSKNSTPDVVQPAGIHAKVNGTAWTAQYANHVGTSGGGHYSIEFDGTDSASHVTLLVTLPDFTGKGTHTITASSADKAYFATDTGSAAPTYATSGTVTVTMLNDTAVSGTFSFTAGGNTITEGTFNVNY